jgi:hypothetical protein
VSEGGAELGLAARIHGGVEFSDDTFAMEFEAVAFGFEADLFGAESGLTGGTAAGSGFFLLRFDVFRFPTAGHNLYYAVSRIRQADASDCVCRE